MLTHRQTQQVRIVADRISRYLESRPEVLDSLEGILHWWLLKQKVEESEMLVQAALDNLVTSGVVERFKLGDNTFYKSAQHSKSGETENG